MEVIVAAKLASVNIHSRLIAEEAFSYFVLRAPPPTLGIMRSTPNGAFLSCKYDLSSSMASESCSGVYVPPPMTPRPPALVTAAASRGLDVPFMPASTMGCLIPKSSVTGVLIFGAGKNKHVSMGRVWANSWTTYRIQTWRVRVDSTRFSFMKTRIAAIRNTHILLSFEMQCRPLPKGTCFTSASIVIILYSTSDYTLL